ncbi:MAG: DEAD/DEAH box helicase, partial [Dehalococcoidia bacterium]
MPRRARPVASSRSPGPRAPRGERSQVETLLRILELEAGRDFRDTTVTGGLDRFLDNQRDELGGFPLPDQPYAEMSAGDRRHWADAVRQAAAAPQSAASRPAPGTARPPPSGAPASPAPAPSARARAKPPRPSKPVTLDTLVEDLAFLPRTAPAKLRRLEVATLRDLLWHFPRRHIDYSNVTRVAELEVERETTVIVKVLSATTARIGPPPGAARVTASDGTGVIEVTWFRQAYLARRFKPGTRLVISGKVGEFRGKAQFQNPEYEVMTGDSLLHAGNLLPVYPGTEGLVQRTLRNAARNALEAGLPLLEEHLPADIRERHSLPGLKHAVRAMHLPEDAEDAGSARRRLAFDELFVNQLGVQRRKLEWRSRGGGIPIGAHPDVLDSFLGSLDFALTADQRESLDTVLSDMAQDVPMGRLLQGEVGSGKTVVAVAALLAAVAAGHQGVLLAPTEVLAEQHFLSLRHLLGGQPAGSPVPDDAGAVIQGALLGGDAPDVERPASGRGRGQATPLLTASVPGLESPLTIALLLGSLTPRQKAGVRELIASGEVDIAVGTHALIQEDV